MGRAPCCDKANVKKGPWSPEEDAKLKSYIEKHGTGGNWIALPQKIGLKRCGKSCRLRWLNYLRPNIKHGGFSEEEDTIICSLYISIGSRWSIIAAQLPGRTDNDIKNYWNTRLKKKLLGKQRKEQQATRREMRKGIRSSTDNSVVIVEDDQNNNYHHHHQIPYWPELPVLAPIPYSNQEPRLNDHASMRKLLIKLGGRFSDDNQQIQQDGIINGGCGSYPISISSSQQVYEQPAEHILLSAPVVDTLNNQNSYQFASTGQYTTTMEGDQTGLLDMLQQGQHNSSTILLPPADDQLEQMVVYSNNTQGSVVDGLEFLYGDDMLINYRSINIMGEMSSSVAYSQLAASSSNCEHPLQQDQMLQECSFDELRYHGAQ